MSDTYATETRNDVFPERRGDRASVRLYHFVLSTTVFLFDQLTKSVIVRKVPLDSGWIDVIPNFFAITHAQNRGAAFSLFADGSSNVKLTMLILFSAIAMIGISWFLWKSALKISLTTTSLALILGGAVGNLWDRVLHGSVTDFLHFYIGEYSWPDFNIADSAIVVGATLIILEILFSPQHHEHQH